MLKILFITHTPPSPPDTGSRQRTNLLLRALKRLGDVDLVLVSSPRATSSFSAAEVELWRAQFGLVACVETGTLERYALWLLMRLFGRRFVNDMAGILGRTATDYSPHPTVARWLARRLARGQYHLVVGRYVQPTAFAGALAHAPIILDVDDLDDASCRSTLRMTGLPLWTTWSLRRQLGQLEHIIPHRLSRADHLWVCCTDDQSQVGRDRSTVLPNIPFPRDEDLAPLPNARSATSNRVLLVANLRYAVNERAVDRFLKDSWPHVRLANPEAVLRIVGSGMSPEQRSRWSHVGGVDAAGFVEDLRHEYAQAAFSVAPLYEGGGTKIKVVESLAHGRTCVVTPHAHRGYTEVLKHGESLWCGENDVELARGCIELLANLPLRERLAQHGAALAREQFTFENFARIVRETIERVLGPGSETVKPSRRGGKD